jgi:hypothetical protein
MADLFSKSLRTPVTPSYLNLSRHANTRFPSLPESHFSQRVILVVDSKTRSVNSKFVRQNPPASACSQLGEHQEVFSYL